MKPVIKKQTHYNLLLVKDDSEAKTFRLHGTVLRLLIWFVLLLALGGAAGIAGGVYYWEKYRSLQARHGELDRETAEMRLQLERLSNLECLIVASNGSAPQPQTRNEEVGAVPRQTNATASPANATAVPAANATALSPDAVLAANATAEGRSATAANATDAAPAVALAGGRQANSTPADSPPAPAETAVPSLEDADSPLRIAGFQARSGGSQRVRVSYELSTTNPEEMRTISGSARYEAVFGNGTRLELPSQDLDGTRFSIVRMKPMQSSARLLPGFNVEDIDSINVFVDTSDGRTFRQSFPFTK